jgi:hypothetical protein
MPLKFIPKFIYNATTLTLTYPSLLWKPSSKPIGGSNVSDSGVPEAFIIRRDQMVDVTIRFTEAEWPNVDALIDWGQRGNSFDYWFDKDVSGTAKTVYLLTPAPGDGEVAPERDSEWRYVYTLPLKMRTTNNAIINVST